MTVVLPQLRLQPVPTEAVDEQHDTLRAVTQLLEPHLENSHLGCALGVGGALFDHRLDSLGRKRNEFALTLFLLFLNIGKNSFEVIVELLGMFSSSLTDFFNNAVFHNSSISSSGVQMTGGS